jgi:predicted AAA+ superfamily ATPase
MPELTRLIFLAESLLERLGRGLPETPVQPDWSVLAFHWRRQHGCARLQAVRQPHRIRLADLRGIDAQKELLVRNTRQFLHGLPANNVLLTGARGTGKSSLVKALLSEFAEDGLRLVEVDKADLSDLMDLTDLLRGRPERFIVFCDDLSFDADEPGYKALKVALDGSVAVVAENMLIYATSNRRHLMPEFMEENLATQHVGEEIRPGEATEEKVSLSERFGLWLSFYPFDQEAYLDIVRHWLRNLGIARLTPQARCAALQFALQRGSRSGRVAWQFARDWAGRQGLRD